MSIRRQLVFIVVNAVFGLAAVSLWEFVGIPGIFAWILLTSAINIRGMSGTSRYIELLEKTNRDYAIALKTMNRLSE